MLNIATIENWVKRDDRCDVQLTARAYRSDGSSLDVTLRNISYEGCLLVADQMLRIGEKLTLALPRMGEIKTRIRWASMDGRAGLQFLAEEMLASNSHSTVGL